MYHPIQSHHCSHMLLYQFTSYSVTTKLARNLQFSIHCNSHRFGHHLFGYSESSVWICCGIESSRHRLSHQGNHVRLRWVRSLLPTIVLSRVQLTYVCPLKSKSLNNTIRSLIANRFFLYFTTQSTNSHLLKAKNSMHADDQQNLVSKNQDLQ